MASVSDEVFSSTPWENVEKSIDEYAQQHPEEVEAFNREASINNSGSVYQNALNEQSYLNSFNSSQEPTNETTDAQDTQQYQETPQQEQPVDNAQHYMIGLLPLLKLVEENFRYIMLMKLFH